MSSASLRRRLRGYDREQTDRLLAELSSQRDELRAERDALTETVGYTQRKGDEARRELEGRERLASELEQQIRELKRENARLLEDLRASREELLQARLAQQRQQTELAEQEGTLARLEVRERALMEQLLLLKGELQRDTADLPASRLERLVESVAHETRREPEPVAAAESETRELEGGERETADDLQQHLGEALWTSRTSSEHAPQ